MYPGWKVSNSHHPEFPIEFPIDKDELSSDEEVQINEDEFPRDEVPGDEDELPINDDEVQRVMKMRILVKKVSFLVMRMRFRL